MWPIIRTGRQHRLQHRIARLLDERGAALPRSGAGVIFLVRLGDGREVVRSFGGGGSPATLDERTVFQVMSISKPVVAMAVLRMAEMGVIDLDAPVVDMLRTWRIPPERTGGFDPSRITLRRILCHAAGLNIHGYDWCPPGRRPSATELLDGVGVADEPLRIIAPPGEKALYSGGGFTLLQQVIEDVTGRAFAEVMREVLLLPLRMEHSSFDHQPAAAVATRHDAEGNPLPPALIAAAACSGLYSTARDLTRFLHAVNPSPERRARIISRESAALMTRAQAIDAAGRAWALGFYMLEFPGGAIIHHGGLKQGWWNQIDSVVGHGHSIVTLTNGDASEIHVKPIVAELRKLLLNNGSAVTSH